MYWYWWVWFAILVFFVIAPLSYGWGYRRWGPPYPRYYYNRRYGMRAGPGGNWGDPGPAAPEASGEPSYGEPAYGAVAVESPPEMDQHPGWGILADLVWLAVIGAIIWAIVAFWWF